MDWLTNDWWLWLGVIALLSWAYARYRRTFASQHTHPDHGAHRDDLKKENRDAHASQGGGCCGSHGKH